MMMMLLFSKNAIIIAIGILAWDPKSFNELRHKKKLVHTCFKRQYNIFQKNNHQRTWANLAKSVLIYGYKSMRVSALKNIIFLVLRFLQTLLHFESHSNGWSINGLWSLRWKHSGGFVHTIPQLPRLSCRPLCPVHSTTSCRVVHAFHKKSVLGDWCNDQKTDYTE